MRIELIIWGRESTLFRSASRHHSQSALIASRGDLIRAFNDYDIASTICAGADAECTRTRLEAAGLWHELILPRLDAADGADSIRGHIAELGLEPGEVLLVDDDPRALSDARALMPDLRILNAGASDADAILEAMLIAQRRPWRTRSDIALLFGEMTRSIAHFSRLRTRLDLTVRARTFALSNMISGPMEDIVFPPTLVYGAGLDYIDARWPDLANLLDCEGLLEACIHLLCERVTAARARMLVVLPSAGDLLIPTVQLRRRTIRFNAAWRDAAHQHGNVDILEIPSGSAGGAIQLRNLAAAIDDWVDESQAIQVKVA